ncbi:kinase-like protein [Aspergillus venezuelensis]
MSSLCPSLTRLSCLLRKRPLPTPKAILLPHDAKLDEQNASSGYKLKQLYPAYPGEVFGGSGSSSSSYQLLVKIGRGASSTVWLARDMNQYRWEPKRAVALKILSANSHSAENNERGIEEMSADHFSVPGSKGSQLCLAYEPMREPLSLFRRRFNDGVVPLPIVKVYTRLLLTGLDYLHRTCKIVHPDLKFENIMAGFEDPFALGDFLDSEPDKPVSYIIDPTGRPVYHSNASFGPLKTAGSLPISQITDLGLPMHLDNEDEHGMYPIQPNRITTTRQCADIWNLSVLLLDMLQGSELFRGIHTESGGFDAKAHLLEMIGLLGPPPLKLLARSRSMLGYGWPDPTTRADGKVCQNAEQFFDGSFFEHNGHFIYEHLILNRYLEYVLPPLQGRDREDFLSFMKQMLC